MVDLDRARAIIDAADEQIVKALSQRFQAVASVGASKIRDGKPAVDPARRQAVIDKAVDMTKDHGGDPELTRRVYELMTDYCADIQHQYMQDGTGPLAPFMKPETLTNNT